MICWKVSCSQSVQHTTKSTSEQTLNSRVRLSHKKSRRAIPSGAGVCHFQHQSLPSPSDTEVRPFANDTMNSKTELSIMSTMSLATSPKYLNLFRIFIGLS